jgi:hypothetical protein
MKCKKSIESESFVGLIEEVGILEVINFDIFGSFDLSDGQHFKNYKKMSSLHIDFFFLFN